MYIINLKSKTCKMSSFFLPPISPPLYLVKKNGKKGNIFLQLQKKLKMHTCNLLENIKISDLRFLFFQQI